MSYIPLPQDTVVTPAVVSIDIEHSRIHSGKAFLLNGQYTLANATTAYVLLDNPAASYPHLRQWGITTTAAPVDVFLYEGATVTANGTTKTGLNLNRNSATTPTLATYTGPTVTVDGTLLEYVVAPGAKQSGGEGLDPVPTEWILKPSTKYVFKITNNSGSTITYSLKVF